MAGVNNEEHLRAFLVGALLTWLVLDFRTKRRYKKFKKTEKIRPKETDSRGDLSTLN